MERGRDLASRERRVVRFDRRLCREPDSSFKRRVWPVRSDAAAVCRLRRALGGYSTALVAPLVGMALMVPGYAIAALGSLIRSLSENREQSKTP
jgi:hypothetical protein